MGEGKKGQNCPPQGTEILTKDKVRNGPNYAPKVPAAKVYLMVFSLMLEKIYMKITTSALFLTWTQQPLALGPSPAPGGFPKATSPACRDHLQPGDDFLSYQFRIVSH